MQWHQEEASLEIYDICTSCREVELVVSTHAAGGLTLNDFVLCAKLDMLKCSV
jgi:pterin-4a-carbinolamine dehydratase